MDDDVNRSPERASFARRAAMRTRRLARPAIWAVLLCLVVPPFVQVAADLWLLAWARGERDGEEARAILMRSVSAGAGRAAEVRYLFGERARGAGPGTGPVISLHRPTGFARAIPMCAGARRRPDQSPERPTHAYAAVAYAEFRLTIERLGAAGLVALDACLNASLFGRFCEGPFREARRFDRDAIESELIQIGAARPENGRACWCDFGPCSWFDRAASG